MNEPNSLESQLRSWMPRRPSAKLAEKLFATGAIAETRRPFSLNWLAPATVGIFSLLVICGAHPHFSSRLAGADTNLFFASVTINNAAMFDSGVSSKTEFNLTKADLNLEQNVWRTASFESTNLPQTHSSSRSLPLDTTNCLTR